MYTINDHTKLYAVSYINWFDHELETHFKYADNKVHAMIQLLEDKGWKDADLSAQFSTVEEVKQFAFDCDGMVHAEEVP